MNRNELETLYTEQTGLNAKRGERRIDILENEVKARGLKAGQFHLIDSPSEINNGWRKGRRWWAGKEIDNMVCLGYSNKGTRRDNCTNAVFMVIDTDIDWN